MEGRRLMKKRRIAHSHYEKGLLITIIETSHDGKYLKILNELSAKSNHEKSGVWLQITREFSRLLGRKFSKQQVRKLYGRIKADKEKYLQACGHFGEGSPLKGSAQYWSDKTQDIKSGILSDQNEIDHKSSISRKETEEQNEEDSVDCLGNNVDMKPPFNLPPIIFLSVPEDETSAQCYNEIVGLQRKYFAEQSQTAALHQAVLRSQLELQGLQKALDVRKLSSGGVKCKSEGEQINVAAEEEIHESVNFEQYNDDTEEEVHYLVNSEQLNDDIVEEIHYSVDTEQRNDDNKEVHESIQSEEKPVKLEDQTNGSTFDCNQCEYKTFQRQKLSYHKTSKHSHVRFRCDLCDYTSNFKGRVKTHMQTKHGQVRFGCPHCDYKATTKGAVATHMKSKHEGTTYYCDQCEFQTNWLTSIASHKRVVHEGVKYSCDQCDYVGSSKNKIIIHKKSKHEGALYHCDQCQYTNSDQRNLVRHIRFIHQGVTYDCDECDMKFSRKSYVTRHKEAKHIKSHTMNCDSLPSSPAVTNLLSIVTLQESD